MDKILKLYKYVDGVNDAPFPQGAEEPIEIGAFRYDAKRMGGAPTITASVNYPTCLDDEWTDNVYAEFNGEKYYLKQTPTSSYNNESAMYRHDLELVSERSALDNIYFFDVVTGDPVDSDKPVSNSTKVVFFGNIKEFARRMNASLEYSKLLKWEDGVDDEGNQIKIANGYNIVVDDDETITTEEKLMSFENQFFSNVLQEIYNTYKVPYYFDGKTIHIGYSKEGVVIPDFSYGVDNALLSITKNNANYKIVNRATGTGSTDNIPFYYPNNAPKGQLDVTIETTSDDLSVRIKDYEKFSDEMKIGDVFSFVSNNVNITNGTSESSVEFTTAGTPKTNSYRFESLVLKDEFVIDCRFPCRRVLKLIPTNSLELTAYGENHMNNSIMETIRQPITYAFHYGVARLTNIGTKQIDIKKIGELEFEVDLSKGTNTLSLALEFKAGYHNFLPIGDVHELNIEGECLWEMTVEGEDSAWRFGDDTINLEDYGLVATGTPSEGDTIAQKLVKYVNTSKNLMPSIYRQSDAKERFYNAVNYPFPFVEGYELKYGEYVVEDEGNVHNDAYKKEDGTYVHFNNPYIDGRPKEHIVEFEDIKPTIKETKNSLGLRMDMFSEFAYDDNDNDETEEDENGDRHFVHSYFFGKLRKLDFNLFDHAIENQPMTISFTSGDCGACNFEVGATEEFPQKNPVLVNADGTLKRNPETGNVICGQFEEITEDECQERQQDTIHNEVWIALKKEESTYGILMPKAPKYEINEGTGEKTLIEAGHRPKACTEGQNDGDTFVIIGINLPESYVINEEKKLEAEIIKSLKENNDEKFTFSIGFSRIYFEENSTILEQLSENSKIRIIYDNKPYDLYVSSFSYNMAEGEVLPEIRVELDETLKVSQNALQNAISQVKSELGNALGSIDIIGATTPYFIRKDADDEARGKINFTKGVKFGEGGKVEILDNNSAKLTIEYLEVTKKASFTSLEIQEKTHVGGQILVTPAAINCGEVEELDDVYRCYFQTKGEDGDEIFNQFAVGDQAICQTYNAWGSVYYWRLVTGIGEDYIDLSKSDCDEESGVPSVGDKIIQLGNREDVSRQNAIVIAAYGDGSPYIIQYKGINNFEIGNDKIVTKLSSTENIFTGKVHMELGSDGLDQLPEWIEVRDTANEALEKAGTIGEDALGKLEAYIDSVRDELQEQIDGAIDSYFEDYEPSTANFPASDWTTIEEKESHLNDTFTNLTDGRSWRWSKVAGSYAWIEIADTATSEALKLAGQAKVSADGKVRMFVSEPHTPYSVGDLWSEGEDAPLMICVKGKETGAFNEDDWSLADDTHSYIDGAIGNIKVGGQNMLRNSGFTGDYLSAQIADQSVLDQVDEMFNPPLIHWDDEDAPAVGATVQDSYESQSGKEVVLVNGSISQKLYQKVIANETYVLSFKARGTTLTYSVGGVTKTVSLLPEFEGGGDHIEGHARAMAIVGVWTRYVEKIEATSNGSTFSILDANCALCDLQLERGTVATAWGNSYLDNSSDRLYYQSQQYVSDALRDATEGSTDIYGGLVLTRHIKVGDDSNATEFRETGGMSGYFTDGNSPYAWAGGDFNLAVGTASKYSTTTATPEGEIPYVVTHGGRVILNDAVVRGKVYAFDGVFSGEVNAKQGTFQDIDILSGKISGFTIGEKELSNRAADASITIGGETGQKFFRVNTFSNEAMVKVRNDGGTLLTLDAYQGGTAAQFVSNGSKQDGTRGYAIKSYGNILLSARLGESIQVNGLAVACRRLINASSYEVHENDDYIVSDDDVTLSGTFVAGKVLMFSYVGDDISMYVSTNNGTFRVEEEQTIMIVFDGESWHKVN